MTRETIIEQLQQVIDTHRKDAHITCPETCWCWDIEKIIHQHELSLPPAEGAEQHLTDEEYQKPANQNRDHPIIGYKSVEHEQQPTAEGAEEILESIVESLGEPINIHNHIFEIRPYTVEHKTEWWIFHKEVGSGEPLTQWLSKFATLHAQRIAEKRLRGELIRCLNWVDKHTYWKEDNDVPTALIVDEYLKTRESHE